MVEAGTLILANNEALADGTSLIVGVGATLKFCNVSSVNSTSAAAIPKLSSLALLGVGASRIRG
jgi:hypothetical protein